MKRHAYIEFREKVEKALREAKDGSLGTNLRRRVKSNRLVCVILGLSSLKMKLD